MLKCESFVKKIVINGTSKQSIINFFSHKRNLLLKNMHLKIVEKFIGRRLNIKWKRVYFM